MSVLINVCKLSFQVYKSLLNCMSMSELCLHHDVVIDVQWTHTAQTEAEMSRAA